MITFIRGTDPKLAITLQQKDSCGDVMPLPISEFMEISVVYKDLTGRRVKDSNSGVNIESAVYGKISISFNDEETEKMRLGTLDFDVHVDEGSINLIWPFIGKVTVRDRLR